MRTTLKLDDDLMKQAQSYTGLAGKSAVVHEALKALVEREASRQRMGLVARVHAALSGTVTVAPGVSLTDPP